MKINNFNLVQETKEEWGGKSEPARLS